MALQKEEVKHIADLARIELTAAEVTQYTKELSAILAYVDELKKLDISAVQEIGQITGLTNKLAKDEVSNCQISRDELLKSAPSVQDGQIKVKSVLGRET